MGQASLHKGHRRGSLRRVKPLEHSDSLHLQAAEGWLELGSPAEAGKDLGGIKGHPPVAKCRFPLNRSKKSAP